MPGLGVTTSGDTTSSIARSVAALAAAGGTTVAVAESLTGGALAEALAKGPEAGEWFAGGVVAYRPATKFRALDVPEGPVVTAAAARAMVRGLISLTGADAAVAVTGVGGPGAAEGEPAGTVFLCAVPRDTELAARHLFAGDPDRVVGQTVLEALRLLERAMRTSP